MSEMYGVRVRDKDTGVESFINNIAAKDERFEVLDQPKKAAIKRNMIPQAISGNKGDNDAGTTKDSASSK